MGVTEDPPQEYNENLKKLKPLIQSSTTRPEQAPVAEIKARKTSVVSWPEPRDRTSLRGQQNLKQTSRGNQNWGTRTCTGDLQPRMKIETGTLGHAQTERVG
jgi:hypothetical protein